MKLFTLLFIHFLLLFSPNIYCQESPDLKEGIFGSFYSFKNNNPLDIKVIVKSSDYNSEIAHDNKKVVRPFVSSGQLKFLTKIKIKNKGYTKRNMWGFYDGKHVYISSKNYTITRVVRYSKILYFGRYSYFIGTLEVHNKTVGLVGGLAGNLPIPSYMILDMESGEVVKLTEQAVEEIVNEFPELYDQFQETRHSDKDLLKYIEAYNDLYKKSNFK